MTEIKGKIPIYGGEKKLIIDSRKKRIREEGPKESLLLFDIYSNEVINGWLTVDAVQTAKVDGVIKMALVVKEGKVYLYEIDNKGIFWWYEF